MKKDRPAWVDMPLAQPPSEQVISLRNKMLQLLDSGDITLENTKSTYLEIIGGEVDDRGARRIIKQTLMDALYSEPHKSSNAWVDMPLFGTPKKES